MNKYYVKIPEWKNFYDINFANMTCDLFSTEKWDFESFGIIDEIYLKA